MEKIIVWRPEMSVGIEEIDNQHKQFIEIISNFYQAFNNSRVEEELGGILKRLIEYAVFHFETEEQYFDKFNYELKDDHKKKHDELKVKVLNFKERFEKEGSIMIPEFTEFLIDWLVNHMEDEDQKYVKCFHEHGLV